MTRSHEGGEFSVKNKVVAIIVDNAANMDVVVKKMSIRKIGCFAHTLNIAAQRIRAMVVWLKRSSLKRSSVFSVSTNKNTPT